MTTQEDQPSIGMFWLVLSTITVGAGLAFVLFTMLGWQHFFD